MCCGGYIYSYPFSKGLLSLLSSITLHLGTLGRAPVIEGCREQEKDNFSPAVTIIVSPSSTLLLAISDSGNLRYDCQGTATLGERLTTGVRGIESLSWRCHLASPGCLPNCDPHHAESFNALQRMIYY